MLAPPGAAEQGMSSPWHPPQVYIVLCYFFSSLLFYHNPISSTFPLSDCMIWEQLTNFETRQNSSYSCLIFTSQDCQLPNPQLSPRQVYFLCCTSFS